MSSQSQPVQVPDPATRPGVGGCDCCIFHHLFDSFTRLLRPRFRSAPRPPPSSLPLSVVAGLSHARLLSSFARSSHRHPGAGTRIRDFARTTEDQDGTGSLNPYPPSTETPTRLSVSPPVATRWDQCVHRLRLSSFAFAPPACFLYAWDGFFSILFNISYPPCCIPSCTAPLLPSRPLQPRPHQHLLVDLTAPAPSRRLAVPVSWPDETSFLSIDGANISYERVWPMRCWCILPRWLRSTLLPLA